MKITARKTHAFVEIKVDEIETTIFKSDDLEYIEKMIHNLLDVCNDLACFTNKSVKEFVEDGGH